MNKLSQIKNHNAREDGITIIELLVVVAIVGIMVSVTFAIFADQERVSLASSVKSDVRNTNSNIAVSLSEFPVAPIVGEGSATDPTGVYDEKDPDAPNINMLIGESTTSAIISDPRTTITVGGSWKEYVIIGENENLKGTYTYNSASGEFIGTDDLR